MRRDVLRQCGRTSDGWSRAVWMEKIMSKTNDTSKLGHGVQDRELSEQELNKISGGDGPPSTAGDGNGRVYLRSLMR
jgi:bacteriocin-like protein